MIIINSVLLRISGGLNELHMGFPGDSDHKEYTCDAGDLGLIPGLEDPLEEDTVFLPEESPWTAEPGHRETTAHRVAKCWI